MMHPKRLGSAIEVYKPLFYSFCLTVEKKSVNIQPLRSRDSERKKTVISSRPDFKSFKSLKRTTFFDGQIISEFLSSLNPFRHFPS